MSLTLRIAGAAPPAVGDHRGRVMELGGPPPVGPLCESCHVDRAQVELDVDELDPDTPDNRFGTATRRRYCVPCLEALVAIGRRAMGNEPPGRA